MTSRRPCSSWSSSLIIWMKNKRRFGQPERLFFSPLPTPGRGPVEKTKGSPSVSVEKTKGSPSVSVEKTKGSPSASVGRTLSASVGRTLSVSVGRNLCAPHVRAWSGREDMSFRPAKRKSLRPSEASGGECHSDQQRGSHSDRAKRAEEILTLSGLPGDLRIPNQGLWWQLDCPFFFDAIALFAFHVQLLLVCT